MRNKDTGRRRVIELFKGHERFGIEEEIGNNGETRRRETLFKVIEISEEFILTINNTTSFHGNIKARRSIIDRNTIARKIFGEEKTEFMTIKSDNNKITGRKNRRFNDR